MSSLFYEDILNGLSEAGVEHVIVGGLAVILHGVPRTTADLDLLVSLEPDNIQRLLQVLSSLGLVPRAPVDPQGLLDPATRQSWIQEKGMMAFTFVRGAGRLQEIDILLHAAMDFETAKSQAVTLRSPDGQSLCIASIDTLIQLKSDTGRAQDASDVDALTRLQDALNG